MKRIDNGHGDNGCSVNYDNTSNCRITGLIIEYGYDGF